VPSQSTSFFASIKNPGSGKHFFKAVTQEL
jgi:hypothetical protein